MTLTIPVDYSEVLSNNNLDCEKTKEKFENGLYTVIFKTGPEKWYYAQIRGMPEAQDLDRIIFRIKSAIEKEDNL